MDKQVASQALQNDHPYLATSVKRNEASILTPARVFQEVYRYERSEKHRESTDVALRRAVN